MKEDKYTKSLAKNQIYAIVHMRDSLFGKTFYPNLLNKALYGDAMFVPLSEAQIWPPETNRNIFF